MEFRFRDIAGMRREMHIDSAYHADEMAYARQDVTIFEPIHIELAIKAGSQGVAHTYGQLTAKMELQCSRCLTSFTETCVIPFDEQFKLNNSTELSAKGEDDVITVADDYVDLKPYVEETFWMNIPHVLLCDEACKGLCATCGSNLNEHLCGCSNERMASKLAVLQDFFKK